MTRRLVLTCAALAAVAVISGAALLAHPGHEHKVLGTVTMAASDHVMLKDKDGKDHTIQINADTKFTRAKKAMSAADMKTGMRVVLTAVTDENDDKVIAESKPGAEERYTVRVPTEGAVATTSVRLEIPDGDKRPAPVTKLTLTPAQPAAASAPADAAAIEAWLKGYDAAFMSKDLDQLAVFYHPDVTIYEGGGINNGWADYRDRHLGPELKAFENLQFGHTDTKVTVLPGGQSAYATSRYTIKAKMGDRMIDSEGLETLLLIKASDGAWKIRHSHTSSRPARRPAAE